MQRWRIRAGLPYRLEQDGRPLLVGLNDADGSVPSARLSVHSNGEHVASYELVPGSTCEIGGRTWQVEQITDGHVDLVAAP